MHGSGNASPRSDEEPPRLRISALGHLRLTRDDTEIELRPPKHRAVLAALAMAEGQPLDADALAPLIWPEEQVPVNPVSGLHVYVSGLRRVLEGPRAPRERPRVLVTSGGGYALDPAYVTIDASEVSEVAARSRRLLQDAYGQAVPRPRLPPEELEQLLEEVERALGQWRGEPYADVIPTLGVTAARARLDAVMISLLEDRAVAQLALGRHAEAAGQLGGLVVERVLDERLWSLYVVALARSERQADALEALRRARHHLAEELGVDPGPALRELEAMVLRQDDALLVAPPSPPPPTEAPPAAEVPTPPAPGSTLVGREQELDLLAEQLAARGTRIVQVVGEAGIGKSTLVAEVLGRVRPGDLVCVARCPEDEGAPPLWPWVELLSSMAEAVAADAPDHPLRTVLEDLAPVDPRAQVDEDAEVARFRLFEAVERALTAAASRRPCVLVLEDLHWAESSTARLVSHLAAAWAVTPSQRDLALVVTRRPDESMVDRAGLGTALDALARHGTLRLDLGGLAADDVTELARRRASWEIDASTAETLHSRTRGNPFMLVELLRLGEDALRGGEVPAGVTDVLHRRLSSMPDITRTSLVAASALGQDFDLDVVAEAAGLLGEETPSADDGVDAVLDALDPAVAAGLVVDSGADRMAFVHALTRDAVYASLTPTRRSRLHARVAEALERRPNRPHAGSAEVARHWLSAGPRHAPRAWRAAREAGLELARRLALDEAADLLDDALTAQGSDETASTEERVDLAEATIAALLRAGRWLEFLVRVDEAAGSAEARADIELLARFAVMPAEAGPWTPRAYGTIDHAALRRMRKILERLPTSDGELRSRVMLALGSELYYVADSARERAALVEEGLAMARRLGDPTLLGRISQRAALVIWRGGNAEERLALAHEAVEAAALAEDVDLLQTSLELRMSAALEAGRIEVMLADVDRAQDLLVDRPTIYHTVVLACLLVPWLAAQGRFGEAETSLVEATRVGGGSQLPWAGLALGTAQVGLAAWRGDLRDPESEVMSVVGQLEQTLPVLRLLVDLRGGNLDGIRSYLHRTASVEVSDDFTSLFHHALVAEAAYVVGDPVRGADAYAALAADAGHVASAGTGIPLGPVDAFLALAAASTGDLARASRHAKDAAALNRDWGLSSCDAWLDAHRARGGW